MNPPLTPEEYQFVIDGICREVDYCHRGGDREDMGLKILEKFKTLSGLYKVTGPVEP